MSFFIGELKPAHSETARTIADAVGGDDYVSAEDFLSYVARSARDGVSCALGAWSNSGEMLGFRFTLPPGGWTSGRGRGLRPDAWPAPLASMGYFQSCFVDPQHTGRGIGRALSQEALRRLFQLGAKGVVAHSWKESPHNSSRRVLERLGFRAVAEYPDYWGDIPYHCHACGGACHCTAVEMVRVNRADDPLFHTPSNVPVRA